MKHVYQATGVANISDADDTTQFTVEAPFNGTIRLEECFVRWSEATGTQSTTEGVLSIEVAGVEVATLGANISDAIGETQLYTAVVTDTNGNLDENIEFSAGDDIVLKVKTQAVGGTITGDGDVFMSLEWGV